MTTSKAVRNLVSVVWLLLPLAPVLVGCAGQSPAAPEAAVAVRETSVPTPVAGEIKVLPTPTPMPLPPTPTPAPSATAAPTQPTPTAQPNESRATALPTATTAPQTTGGAMISIPAGEFTMGSDFEDQSPPHPLRVDAFEIDTFEVTNEAFEQFVRATGYQTEGEKANEVDTWRSYGEGKPTHPVVKVTWNDAVAYCQWAGKRLPTEVEWEKAARGTEASVYPWGSEWDKARANSKESGYRGTTAVGSFPSGASPYGMMDMAGNVAEWTSDWYKAYPGSTFASPYFGETYRVIRGGGWFSDKDQVKTTARSASSVDLRNDDVGFRCAR